MIRNKITSALIHLLSPLFLLLVPVIAYIISDNQFTKNNAINIINWQITAILSIMIGFLLLLLGSDDLTINGNPIEWAPILPEPIATISAFIGFLLAFLPIILSLLIYPIYGFVTAIRGKEKPYPLTYPFI